jgi:hypothetical protein
LTRRQFVNFVRPFLDEDGGDSAMGIFVVRVASID